jgi:quinol monooxygenase YgiN
MGSGAMALPIVYVDVSEIRDGKLEELEQAMSHLVQFVEANMARIISYGFFIDPKRTTMTVVAIHPDAASLEFHLDEGRDEFRKFAHLIDLSRIEVYGSVTEAVVERLQRKARMLGRGSVAVHGLFAGFSR